ncbi:MAG: hypothetical protein F6K36_08090 [Symploca sp. SIO3C6]|uniref:Uncharacterized protein n=1 Tax=Symploca sp. SIO1C4 TaxID=2607765 RepID=A0A6B3N750_9CYAN|nr:hypothetical protein [Symploca sp. SIO3C6]NER27430.1 hypothetical protein [Symploca sp. SIO1C4]NET03733.1 hypothetical protein [Symploca sp. SIO2B6]
MLPSLPETPQLLSENKCPACFNMKLEAIPVTPEDESFADYWHQPYKNQQIDLYLSLNFSQQWASFPGGRVKFGFRGGELILKLDNSEIPFESRELAGSIKLSKSISTARQESEAEKAPDDLKATKQASNAFDISNPLAKESFDVRQNSLKTDNSQVSICRVTRRVSLEHPAWIFERERGKSVLQGSLHRSKLATLNVLALPCQIEATFEVGRQDVCLTDAEGVWLPQSSRNKRAVLERLIIERLLEPKFRPFLSRGLLQYG